MADLPLDTWELNHIEARREIRALPADSDFDAIREREEARDKGPRPSVIAVLDERTAPPEAGEEDTQERPPELPPAEWTEHEWRGHKLYKCRHCPSVQSFDIGVIYEHARRFHPTG